MGAACHTEGPNAGRLRLDDPDDWVRQEICSTLASTVPKHLIVVRVDDAQLPTTRWGNALDELHDIQSLPLRNQTRFEHDLEKIFEAIDRLAPALYAEARPQTSTVGGRASNLRGTHLLHDFLKAQTRNVSKLSLPLIDEQGHPIIAPMDTLHIELPWIYTHRYLREEEAQAYRFLTANSLARTTVFEAHMWQHFLWIGHRTWMKSPGISSLSRD